MQLELQILKNSKDPNLQVRAEDSFETKEWCNKKFIPTNFCPCSFIFQRGAMGSTEGWHFSLWLLIHQATKFVFTSTLPLSQICFSVLHPHPTSERPVGHLWLIPAGSVQSQDMTISTGSCERLSGGSQLLSRALQPITRHPYRDQGSLLAPCPNVKHLHKQRLWRKCQH